VIGSRHAILAHLTVAAEAMQAARALADDAGLDITSQVIARSAIFVGSAIATVNKPIDVAAVEFAGVVQPPVKPKKVRTTQPKTVAKTESSCAR
jgi:hypothetical protein